ncbi:MAG: hypothetical protein DRJ64_03810 [Thermoprotei archaeon]|nr:MAG: hypothetical protein DRJ64_03810 [Thermoprotei archaeon]
MSYITITAGFNASDNEAKMLLSTAWLFKLATHRVFSYAKATPILPASKVGWKNMFRKVAYKIIPNRRYADSIVILVMGIYESCRRLGIDFQVVELGYWLIFQQSEKEYPPRSITLKSVNEAWVTVFDYHGDTNRLRFRVSTSKKYKELLKALLAERQPYNPRIVLKQQNVRGGKLYVKGELHVSIPLDFYYRHMVRFKGSGGSLCGGVDVNADRINLAIVDRYGRLRDVRTFWFEEVSRKGCPGRRARAITGMRVHEMLKYAYHHGVKTLFLENPNDLGKLRLLWIRSGKRLHRNYNWKVSVFRSSVIEAIAVKAPLYSIRVIYVNPRGTTCSREHDKIMRIHGLDRHSASAYLIALKGIKRHTMIQKDII